MSIYLRGKSWYYDFIHKGQRYTGSFGQVSRTVAKEELARKKAEVVEGGLNPAKARKSPRFDVFAEEYLAWAKMNRRPETYRRLAYTAPRFVASFGQKKLSELTPWHLEQYKKHRREADKQPSTINVELAVLNAMLRPPDHKRMAMEALENRFPGKVPRLFTTPYFRHTPRELKNSWPFTDLAAVLR